MPCPHCNAALTPGAAFCAACGTPVAAAAAPAATPPAATPITAADAVATARQVGAQLESARRSLPYGSVHIAAAAAAVAALLLSFTSWGARGSWLLTILALAGIAATGAADLRRRGAFSVASWPLSDTQETLLAAAGLVLLAATTLVSLHLRLGSLLWLVALAAGAWGAWPLLRPHLDLRPSHLLGGYRALAVAGVVVLLAAMTQGWGQASSTLLPGYGYTCDFTGCGWGVGYGTGSIYVAGVSYPGVAVEWAEIVVVVLFVALAVLLLAEDARRPGWLRFVPAGAAALSVAWLAWSLAGSILVKGGSKQLGWWVAIVALVAFAAGSALIALGHTDGDYAPARLVRRLRGEQPAA